MEGSQIAAIEHHLEELIGILTNSYERLLKELESKSVLSPIELRSVRSQTTGIAAVAKLIILLEGTQNTWKILLQFLKDSSFSSVADRLSKTALKYQDASQLTENLGRRETSIQMESSQNEMSHLKKRRSHQISNYGSNISINRYGDTEKNRCATCIFGILVVAVITGLIVLFATWK